MWASTVARRAWKRRPAWWAALFLAAIATSRSALAQPSSTPADSAPAQANADALTTETLECRLKEIDQLQGIEEPVRVELRGLLKKREAAKQLKERWISNCTWRHIAR